MTLRFSLSRRPLMASPSGTPTWRRLVNYLLVLSGLAAATPLAVLWITSGRVEPALQQRLLCISAGACVLSLLLIQGAALLVEVQARRARGLLQKAALRGIERQLTNAQSQLQRDWPGGLRELSRTEPAGTQAKGEGFKQLGEQILENVSEAVILVAADGVLMDANSAAAEMLGYSREEAAGKQLRQLLPDDPEDHPEQRLDSYLLSGNWNLHGRRLEVRFTRRDGSVFPAEVKLGECCDGPRKFFFVSWSDTTESKQAELLSQDRLQIVEMIARNQPLDAVLANLAQMIERQMRGSRCVVMRRRGNRLFPAAAPNLPESFVGSLCDLPVGPSNTSCGAAAFEGKTAIVTDIASDPRWEGHREGALEHGLRACWSAPVFTGEGLVIGTVAVYRRETGEPDGAQLELLRMASLLASMCMEQKEFTGQLAYRAHHDALTGLPTGSPLKTG
jgi:PAS domain S-box-containing protein